MSDGEVEAVHGIIIDITERRRSDEELALVRRDLELAVEGAQLGVWSYDPKTGSCWFSDRAKALLELDDNILGDARDLRDGGFGNDGAAGTGQRQVGGQPGHRGCCGLGILVFPKALPLLFVTTLVPATDNVAASRRATRSKGVHTRQRVAASRL